MLRGGDALRVVLNASRIRRRTADPTKSSDHPFFFVLNASHGRIHLFYVDFYVMYQGNQFRPKKFSVRYSLCSKSVLVWAKDDV